VKIFTETIDWAGGDDPQYCSVVPVTPAEAKELIGQGERVDTQRIEAISRDRCHLRMDYPRGETQQIYWAEGPLRIGSHD